MQCPRRGLVVGIVPPSILLWVANHILYVTFFGEGKARHVFHESWYAQYRCVHPGRQTWSGAQARPTGYTACTASGVSQLRQDRPEQLNLAWTR